MLRGAMLALALSLVFAAAGSARDVDRPHAGLGSLAKDVTVVFTCDDWIDHATGEIVKRRCYASKNRYCWTTRRRGCTKRAPWVTTASRSPARVYR